MPEPIANVYKALTVEEQQEVNNFIYFIMYKRQTLPVTDKMLSDVDKLKSKLTDAPITASMLGILKDVPIGDYKSEIENALSEKYGY